MWIEPNCRKLPTILKMSIELNCRKTSYNLKSGNFGLDQMVRKLSLFEQSKSLMWVEPNCKKIPTM